MTARDRLERFPTQATLTAIWIVAGLPTCIILRNSLLWVIVMSWYAIVTSHWSAHLAWRAERNAASDDT